MLKILTFSCLLHCVLADYINSNNAAYEGQRPLSLQSSQLTGECLYEHEKKYPGKYAGTALLPALIAIGQTALFLEGRSLYEALYFLKLKNKRTIQLVFPSITKPLYDSTLDGESTLNLNVYTDVDNKFCPYFTYTYNKTFTGKTRVLDYSDPEKAAADINREIKNAGPGFTNIVSSEMIRKGAGLNFISSFKLTVMYDRFPSIARKTILFNTGKKIVPVPGVTGEGMIKYANNKFLDAKVIQINGKGGIISYVTIIPNKRDGVLDLLAKLREYRTFERALEDGESVCAKVTTPSTNIKATTDLGEYLKKSYYLNGFFEKGGLQLEGATEMCYDTYISSIRHEIFLGPDEIKLSKSGACSKYQVEIEVNRPHLFFVTYTKKSGPVSSPIVGIIYNTPPEY